MLLLFNFKYDSGYRCDHNSGDDGDNSDDDNSDDVGHGDDINY